MGWLADHVALVTGGGSGIGRGVVDAFVAEGARVGVLDVVPARLAEVERAHGDRVVVVQGDATALETNEHAVAATLRAFGKLDTLVGCVGVFDYYTALRDIPADKLSAAFDEIYSINVKSYLLAAKAALPALLASEGSIILTASAAGYWSDGAGFLYGSSKFAVRGLVVHLAYELAPRVRVNGVAPGGTSGTRVRGLATLGHTQTADTVPGRDERLRQTNPLGVVATPADHAWAYVYLAAKDRSRAVTGTVIHSDGGRGVAGVSRLAGLTHDDLPSD